MTTSSPDEAQRKTGISGNTCAVQAVAAKKMAHALPDQESSVTLSRRDFATFHKAISGAFTPNAALQDAMTAAARVKRT